MEKKEVKKDIIKQSNEEESNTKEEPTESVALTQSKQNDILAKLVREDDLERSKDLTHLFNMYQAKRNALRISTLNDVQDALVKQMLERLEKYPDNFNNKDIADWMKTVQMVMDNSSEKVEQLDTMPTIKYQQNNQVNVNIVDGLSRESRERITNVLEALLNGVDNNGEDMVLGNEIIEDEGSSSVENSDESE